MSKTAMKLALEALEAGEYYIDDLEAIVYAADDLGTHEDRAKMQEAITALREALAEQPAQQEPVAWRTYTGRGYYIIDATLKEAQRNWPDKQHQPLYTSPPAQRTWVGLTDEEITDIWAEASPYYHEDDFARAIEAKLKEKNT